MNKLFLWAALLAALSSYSMHVSSDDDADIPLPKKSVEMKNLAANPRAQTAEDFTRKSSTSSDDTKKEYKPICFGNMNKKPSGLYSHMYTLASVDKNCQGKS